MGNDTQTLTLTKFLLARIAQEEAAINRSLDHDLWHAGLDRRLAECEAKRRIVEDCAKTEYIRDQGHRTQYAEGEFDAYHSAARLLAAVYADHPDYRAEWKP